VSSIRAVVREEQHLTRLVRSACPCSSLFCNSSCGCRARGAATTKTLTMTTPSSTAMRNLPFLRSPSDLSSCRFARPRNPVGGNNAHDAIGTAPRNYRTRNRPDDGRACPSAAVSAAAVVVPISSVGSRVPRPVARSTLRPPPFASSLSTAIVVLSTPVVVVDILDMTTNREMVFQRGINTSGEEK